MGDLAAVIVRIQGSLVRLGEGWVELQWEPVHVQVLVPEVTRKRLQDKLGQEVVLHTLLFIEGNPNQGRWLPRLLGFSSEAEREFFELFCSVDGVGARKALAAMNRPVQDIAAAIAEKDAKWLSTLPGIGMATAERIVAKLYRKMARFALLVAPQGELPAEDQQPSLAQQAVEALVQFGHPQSEAEQMVQKAMAKKPPPKTLEDLIHRVYRLHRR